MPRAVDIVRNRRKRRERARTGSHRIVRWLAGGALLLTILGITLTTGAGGVLASVYADYVADLPNPDVLEAAFDSSNNEFFQTTHILDRTGQHLLYEVIDPRAGDRQWLGIERIPASFIQATIVIEDKTFYENPGYDLEGILRAFISNLQGNDIQGGSTITQQLVKNVIIAPNALAELSYDRKFREVLIANEVTNRYSKDQILEWYLNTNFYGNLAYGVDAAARVYFGKTATELELAESALLAAIPQFPALNPIDAPQDALQRQVIVLQAMAREGYISASELEFALQVNVLARIHPSEERFEIRAPHFTFYVLEELTRILDPQLVFRGGLNVFTTIDLTLQHQVECVARTQIARLSGFDPELVVPAEDGSPCAAAAFLPALRASDIGVDHKLSNASVVVLRPETGEVLAMLGSVDYWNDAIDGRFNVAVDGMRQPGSSFKPFTYLTAFSQGFTPATMVLDVRTGFENDNGTLYAPENYDRQFHGPVSLRIALARSYNVPAVQVLSWVGVDSVIRTAHRMGINSLDRKSDFYGLALTLGGGEVVLLDMTYAFGVMSNNGIMAGQPAPAAGLRTGFRELDPVKILRIDDANGRTLERCGPDGESRCEFARPDTQAVLSPELAYLITDVLSDEEARIGAFGSPNPLELGRPAAAKTGTTNDFLDNWTLGYTPQLVTGVWVGNSDSSPMENVTGLTGAAPIWHAVMKYATRDLPPGRWEQPAGIVNMRVCYPSGQVPTEHCPSRVDEVFVAGTEPVAFDNFWQLFQINRETGRLATVFTPPELVDERVFQILPPEAADWVRDAGIPQPPTEYDTLFVPPEQVGDAYLTAPLPFTYVRGQVPIAGTARGEDFQSFQLQIGSGLNPTEWTQLGDNREETIEDDILFLWDTAELGGLFSLKLLVVREEQEFDEVTVQVTVDNTPPEVSLQAPLSGEGFDIDDESIVIQPNARDNLSLAYVEIYVDNVLEKTSTVAPFTTRWQISGLGIHQIFVRAFDAAGNQAESETVTVVVEAEE